MKTRTAIVSLVGLTFALAVPLGAAPHPHPPTIYTTISPQDLADILSAEGYAPELDTADARNPVIRMKIEGRRSIITFFNCTEGECRSFQYYAGIAMHDKPECGKVNKFNRERRFGRAYIDKDGDPVIEMDVDLDGGVARDHIVESIATWRAIVSRYFEVMTE